VFTVVFYILPTVCQYLTLYRLLILYHYVHCCLLQSVHGLPVLHTVPSVDSVSLCSLLSSTFCQLSVSTSYCTVCCFCISMSTAAFYSLSTVSQYLTLYRLLVLCHCVHFCLLHSANCLSVPHTVPSVVSVSVCPLLPSTVCPRSPSSSHCTVCCFCISMSTAAFYSLSTVFQFVTLYRLLILCHCVPAVFYILPTVCQYLTLYRLLVLYQYVHCCLLQSVHGLPVPHTVPSVDSVSLCSLLSSTFCQLSVSTSHPFGDCSESPISCYSNTFCWFTDIFDKQT